MGMRLVKIEDPTENLWVNSVIRLYVGTDNSTSTWRWIGAEDLDDDDVWRWSDGAPLSWDQWAGGQPSKNDNCAQMQNLTVPYWNSVPCTLSNPYVCELY
jgi:hypothetical protein